MITLRNAMFPLAMLIAVSGCHVDQAGGKGHENVGINTPFGGMTVKTDDKAVQQGVGLAMYPGATLIKEDKGQDQAADVNFSFGSFHMGVKALSYQTPDAPAKVLAFYKHDMARYGAVVECRGHHAVGTPTRTQDGLTCEDQKGEHVDVRDDDDGDSKGEELKAGSRHHQHIVGVEPQGTGTKIGLVLLDLPDEGSLKRHDAAGNDSDKQ